MRQTSTPRRNLSLLTFNCEFVLASRSPRRHRILRQMGISFTAIPADIDESDARASSSRALVKELALRKAEAIAAGRPSALVLGADTIVVANGIIMGKPNSSRDAMLMLQTLSGKEHTVCTGIALVHNDTRRSVVAVESTRVLFAELTQQEICGYVSTGIPMDKAGSYGIQDDYGCAFVKRIRGDYFNVVGLPAHRLYQLTKQHFPDLLQSFQTDDGTLHGLHDAI